MDCFILPTTAVAMPTTWARSCRAFRREDLCRLHGVLEGRARAGALAPQVRDGGLLPRRDARHWQGQPERAAQRSLPRHQDEVRQDQGRRRQERKRQNHRHLQRADHHQEHPLAAYEYVVNGKPALEWVMERQAVTTDKDSGIVNDTNLWATETMGNAQYPLELFLRVITVSLETMKLVNALPPLGDPADLRKGADDRVIRSTRLGQAGGMPWPHWRTRLGFRKCGWRMEGRKSLTREGGVLYSARGTPERPFGSEIHGNRRTIMNENCLSLEVENQNRHVEQLAEQSVRWWNRIKTEVSTVFDDIFGKNGYRFERAICNGDSIMMKVVTIAADSRPALELMLRLAITQVHTFGPDFEFSFAVSSPIAFGESHSIYPDSYKTLLNDIREVVKSQIERPPPFPSTLHTDSKPTIHPQTKIDRVLTRIAELLEKS